MKPTEEYGWVFTSPDQPDPTCRWCGVENTLVRGVVVCITCDHVRDWPTSQESETP